MRAGWTFGMASALVLAAVVFAGCGSEKSERAGDDAHVEAEARKRGFEGRQVESFAGARGACGTEPRSEFAVAEGLPADSSVVAVARRYAAEWPRNLRRAAFEGCTAGLAAVPVRFPPSSPLARDIWDRHFIVTSVTGGQGDEEPPVIRPIYIRLSFGTERDHSVGWQAMCNGYGGSAHITATKIEVDQVGSTLIGCDPEREEEDEWLAHFMQAGPEWRLEGDQLQLISDRATIELKGFEDPNSCPVSPDGGRVDLGNSGFDCEGALNFLTLQAEGKERYLQGWKCRDGESRSGQVRVLCRHGKRWFAVQGFDQVSFKRQ